MDFSDENFYERAELLEPCRVSWQVTDGEVSGVSGGSCWFSIGCCGSVILGDSVTAVYDQPGIEGEVGDFRAYLDGLTETVFDLAVGSEETSGPASSWTRWCVQNTRCRTPAGVLCSGRAGQDESPVFLLLWP